MQQSNTISYSRSARGTYIAQSQAALADRDNVVVVEKIDPATLPRRRAYHVVKRAFDVLACGGALVVLSPVMLAVAVAVKLDSPGPVIFRQERLGKDGKPFYIHKFRSMRTDAEAQGAKWASENDDRITRVGSLLRKSRLDELPQFWDVVVGNMSLVGPRPERAVFYDEFEQYVRGFKQRLMATPGITGLAQVSGGYDLKPAEKIVYDMEYIKNQGIPLDLKVIAKTLAVLVNHKGAR